MTDEKEKGTPYCWKHAGVFGDSSCPELAELVHCRNCSAYNRAGRSLLDRPVPDEFREEWTRNLAGFKETELPDAVSLIIFRIKNEWLALRTTCLQETTNVRTVHQVPFKSNNVFRGIVNINGELLLSVSLTDLIESAEEGQGEQVDTTVYRRMLVINVDRERYAFPVDEVLGIHRISLAEVSEPPLTVSKSPTTLVEGIFNVQERKVGLLGEEKLMQSLRRSLGN